jgi:hypothetical protein
MPPPPAAAAVVDPYAGSMQNPPSGQYPPGAPFAAAPTGYYAEAPFNTLAIVGFVLAFFVSLGAIICGHIALSQIKRTGERGHGLALAAVIIGYVGLAFGLLYIVILFIFVIAEATNISY